MRAVVMGGTSGIGLAVADALTDAGIKVTVTGRDPVKLAALDGRVAAVERLDCTDRAGVAEFFSRQGQFEHLVLAFSPGAVGMGPVRAVSLPDIEAAFSGKLFAYLHAIQRAEVTESITMISAASARAALPGTVALAGVNGAIERIVSGVAWRRRHRLVVLLARRPAAGAVRRGGERCARREDRYARGRRGLGLLPRRREHGDRLDPAGRRRVHGRVTARRDKARGGAG
jgi:NAD(P)-dependent dehydrogenase (short-subunit alcohol dehydrogenase family)